GETGSTWRCPESGIGIYTMREYELMHSYTARMTLEKQIGQLLVAGFWGTTPSPEIIDLIRDYHIGGIILFSRNVQDAQQVRELKALGINMNFAPVVDVNNNPANPVIGVRSFGEDPRQVARLAAASVRGYRAAGVISNLKHFPGHGDTAVDSHLALPTISSTLEQLEAIELVPFKTGIEVGAD